MPGAAPAMNSLQGTLCFAECYESRGAIVSASGRVSLPNLPAFPTYTVISEVFILVYKEPTFDKGSQRGLPSSCFPGLIVKLTVCKPQLAAAEQGWQMGSGRDSFG